MSSQIRNNPKSKNTNAMDSQELFQSSAIQSLMKMAAYYMEQDSNLQPTDAFKMALARQDELLCNMLETTSEQTLNAIGWATGDFADSKTFHPDLSFQYQPYATAICAISHNVYQSSRG